MNPELRDWLKAIIAAGLTAAGMYAGIRADLAALHEKASYAVKVADKAHDRIDKLQERER